MNVCLSSVCSFPPVLTPFYRRAEVSVSQVLTSPVQIGDSWCLHTQQCYPGHDTVLPARCCRHEGWAGLMVGESWEADDEAGETEIHRKWVLFSLAACGPTCYWFAQCFSSHFLNSTENYFSHQWCFPGTGWSACFKTSDSIIYLLNKRAQQTSFFLFCCFNLVDAFSVN